MYRKMGGFGSNSYSGCNGLSRWSRGQGRCGGFLSLLCLESLAFCTSSFDDSFHESFAFVLLAVDLHLDSLGFLSHAYTLSIGLLDGPHGCKLSNAILLLFVFTIAGELDPNYAERVPASFVELWFEIFHLCLGQIGKVLFEPNLRSVR